MLISQVDEMIRCCKKNIKQHPERGTPFIEANPVEVIELATFYSAMRKAADEIMCGHCDYDEAEGVLVDHCDGCCRQIVTRLFEALSAT